MTKQTNTSNCDHTWGGKLADGSACCVKCSQPRHANNPNAFSNNDPNGDTFGEFLSAPADPKPTKKITPKQIEEALRKKFPGLGDRLIVI